MFDKLVKSISTNLRTKLLALVISVAIWFYATNRLTEQARISVPLQILPPQDWVLLYPTDQSVQLTATGPRSIISRLSRSNTRNYVKFVCNVTERDAKNSPDGWVKLIPQAEWLQGGLKEWELVQLTLGEFDPLEVRAFLSPIEHQTMRVEVRRVGAPPSGFRVDGRPTAEPATVKVIGPLAALQALDGAIPTQGEVSLWNTRTSINTKMDLVDEVTVQLDNGQNVRVPVQARRPTVEVTVNVVANEKELEAERIIAGVPVQWLTPQEFEFDVEPTEKAEVTVTVRGRKTVLRELTAKSFVAFVNLTAIEAKVGPIREDIEVLPARPSQATIVDWNPRQLSLKLIERPGP